MNGSGSWKVMLLSTEVENR